MFFDDGFISLLGGRRKEIGLFFFEELKFFGGEGFFLKVALLRSLEFGQELVCCSLGIQRLEF